MAAIAGRNILVRRNGVVLAGVRVKGISIAGAPIDVTNDDDDGIRKLLDEAGQLDISISVSGVLMNDTLRDEALNADDRVAPTAFEIGTTSPTDGYSGNFFMESYNEGGEYQGHGTFEATFQSAGAVTRLAG
jgi:predicted secreted protein